MKGTFPLALGVAAIIILVAVVSPAKSQGQEGHCIWYGICGRNPDNERKNLYCADDGPARPLNTTEEKAALQEMLPDMKEWQNDYLLSFSRGVLAKTYCIVKNIDRQ
jgi:hypothetical protein